MLEHRSQESKPIPEPDVILTGNRGRKQYRVDVDGQSLWLSCASLIALVDLLCARIQSDAGYRELTRSTVHRLRQDLGEVGRNLIETGDGCEYRIAIPKAKIRDRVSLSPSFFKLVGLAVLSQEQADTLRKACGVSEIEE